MKAEKRNSGLAKHLAVMVSIQVFCFILTPLICLYFGYSSDMSHTGWRIVTAILLFFFNGLIVLYYKHDKLNNKKQRIIFQTATAAVSLFQFGFWVIYFWNIVSG